MNPPPTRYGTSGLFSRRYELVRHGRSAQAHRQEGEHDVHGSGASERIRRFPTRRLDRNLLGVPIACWPRGPGHAQCLDCSAVDARDPPSICALCCRPCPDFHHAQIRSFCPDRECRLAGAGAACSSSLCCVSPGADSQSGSGLCRPYQRVRRTTNVGRAQAAEWTLDGPARKFHTHKISLTVLRGAGWWMRRKCSAPRRLQG
jgi:hypothetical protein